MHCASCVGLLLAGFLALSHSELDEIGESDIYPFLTAPPNVQIAPGNTNFAFRFYHLIASQNPRKNIFFSPLSISLAFSMLSLGADKSSQSQILEGLGFNLTALSVPDIHEGFRYLLRMLMHPDHPDLETHVGIALFLSPNLKLLPRFIYDIEGFYNAKLHRPNFTDVAGTSRLINDYVREKTNGKISNLVSQLSRDMKMVLVNFIYFKGLWEKPFPPSRIALRDFHIDDKTIVQVPMMMHFQEPHWYFRDKRVPCSVLRMDYRGSMVALFVLPHEGKMHEVEQVLSPDMLQRWLYLLQNRYFHKRLTLYMPKFSVSSSYELDRILPMMGFGDLFSPNASFSGITTQQKLWLSKSFHKATMDVNEVGTEAAAVTGVSTVFLSAQQDYRVLMFDRPFFVALFSNMTRSLLFLGKVVNPMES
uniref:kallistatin n=1 Tax=Jaculus jaculus TaxID=51337 RepID=UPI001E1B5BFD|nr:kallistatin [Jaculus jaculus]